MGIFAEKTDGFSEKKDAFTEKIDGFTVKTGGFAEKIMIWGRLGKEGKSGEYCFGRKK